MLGWDDMDRRDSSSKQAHTAITLTLSEKSLWSTDPKKSTYVITTGILHNDTKAKGEIKPKAWGGRINTVMEQ